MSPPQVAHQRRGATGRRLPAGSAQGRLLLLSGGGVALLVGIWTGLARAGVHEPVGPVMAHGVLMVLGFLGTLIALERAVALRSWWAYAAPALSGAAVVCLLLGAGPPVAGALLTTAGVVLAAAYLVLLHRRFETHLALMAVGAMSWVVAAALWTLGHSPVALAPMLSAFPVFTVLGERLELSRLRMPTARHDAGSAWPPRCSARESRRPSSTARAGG